MSPSDLIPGVAQVKTAFNIIIAVAIIGVIGYGYFEWRDYQKLKANYELLETNNKQLQVNVDTVKADLDTCKSANSTSDATIKSLLQERSDAQAAVAKLAAAKRSDGAVISGLQGALTNLRKDPKNDGTLAPDLRETIRGIQAGRKS